MPNTDGGVADTVYRTQTEEIGCHPFPMEWSIKPEQGSSTKPKLRITARFAVFSDERHETVGAEALNASSLGRPSRRRRGSEGLPFWDVGTMLIGVIHLERERGYGTHAD